MKTVINRDRVENTKQDNKSRRNDAKMKHKTKNPKNDVTRMNVHTRAYLRLCTWHIKRSYYQAAKDIINGN